MLNNISNVMLVLACVYMRKCFKTVVVGLVTMLVALPVEATIMELPSKGV